MTRQKPPRLPAATLIPLDEGARLGPEPWTSVDGLAFCHWDRWLLRLAIEDPEGLAGIAERFASRVRSAEREDSAAEALHTQIHDLQARLALLVQTPAAILNDVERASVWLLRKATRRVWDGSIHRPTEVMRRTPRNVFVERARTGWWSNPLAFPVSPWKYYRAFVDLLDMSSYDVSVDERIVSAMNDVAEHFLHDATSEAEQLAIIRGCMTASADAIERLNTDGYSISSCLDNHMLRYFELLGTHVDVSERRRDLLEFAVWEGYGLLKSFVPFVRGLVAADRGAPCTTDQLHSFQLIKVELRTIAAELRAALLKDLAASAEQLSAAIAVGETR